MFCFNSSQPHGWEMVSHCGLDLYFRHDVWYRTSLHVLLAVFIIVFGEMSIQVHCQFLIEFLLLIDLLWAVTNFKCLLSWLHSLTSLPFMLLFMIYHEFCYILVPMQVSKKGNFFFQCICIVFFSFKIAHSGSPIIYSLLLLKMLLYLLMNDCFGCINFWCYHSLVDFRVI